MNFLSGRLSAVGRDEVELTSDETGGTISIAQSGIDASVGDQAWFAIRPEKMRISLDEPADTSVNTVSGEVWDIGYLGDLSVYRVRLPSGHVIKSTVTNQTRLVERPITWEDKVWLSWPREGGIVLTR